MTSRDVNNGGQAGESRHQSNDDQVDVARRSSLKAAFAAAASSIGLSAANARAADANAATAMTRVPTVIPDQLSPGQRKVHDAIVSTRQGGEIRGPFAVWIRNPELAAAANQLSNAIRLNGKLEAKLFELIVLIIARQWSAQYEWFAHAQEATRAGLDAQIVEAIRTHRVPHFQRPQETVIYEMVQELTETKEVSDVTYDRALKIFGVDLIMEIVTVAGFYTLVAMMVNAFRSPVPGNVRPLD